VEAIDPLFGVGIAPPKELTAAGGGGDTEVGIVEGGPTALVMVSIELRLGV
jgi:hypothetical protein